MFCDEYYSIHKFKEADYMAKCSECGGKGKVECECTGGCGRGAADDDCIACGGSGVHTCPACRGTGKE